MGETLRPKSLAELEKIIAWAVSEETTLKVQGNGSKSSLGYPVEAAHHLEATGLAGIDMYEPEELVMSCGAGTPLAEIEQVLDERGQQLAFEPYDFGAATGGNAKNQTIGGVFAANISGPRRLKAGAARDHLLGLQVVSGHGQLMKTGGRVVKNVTGYDLCKLLTGSFGTLAVMSHVTFKVLPAPAGETTLVLQGTDLAQVAQALRRATGTAYEISGAALVPGDGYAGYIRIEGSAPSVAYRAEQLQVLLGEGLEASQVAGSESKSLWRKIRDGGFLPAGSPIIWRISMPPSDLPALVASLNGPWFADWAGGLVWYAGESERPKLPSTGHAVLIKRPLDVTTASFPPQEASLAALTRRVKNSFDPKAVLNPGRMYVGI